MIRALTFIGVLAVASPAAAQGTWTWSEIDPINRNGQVRFEAPAYSCDHASALNGFQSPPREIPAIALPWAVTITHVSIWMGTDYGYAVYPAVDLFATLFTSRPHNYVLASLKEDRYAPPSHQRPYDVPKNHRLEAGDQLGGGFGCASLIWWWPPSHVKTAIIVDFTLRGES